MKYKIWLVQLDIYNKIKLDLLSKYETEKNIYDNFNKVLIEDPYINKRLKGLDKEKSIQKACTTIEWMNKNKVGFLSRTDSGYPKEFKELEDMPYGVFYKGNIDLLNTRKVAFVGSRKCTNYGIQLTKMLTKEVISYNITIISGGAKGIDSIAHNEAIKENGNTIIVLGCGIDVVYPIQNRNLFKEVENKGLIISEFLPNTPPFAYNFPRRNRIISGLSELVLVLEASIKSGSLITAGYAATQGRTVMAIPGSVLASGSAGCNLLISEGAQVYTSMVDLHLLLRLDIKSKHAKGEKSISQKKILAIIENEPKHIDEIFNKTCIDRETLFNVLFEMQMRNEIISLPGNYYAKII